MLLHVKIPCCFMRIIHDITCKDSMLSHEDYTCCYMERFNAAS